MTAIITRMTTTAATDEPMTAAEDGDDESETTTPCEMMTANFVKYYIRSIGVVNEKVT